jgi:N-acetylglucosamine-6-phosphate deacetylase
MSDVVLFHVHGIAGLDFSALAPHDLREVQAEAERRKADLVPTIFLRRAWLTRIEAVLAEFARAPERYPRILGFAIEGPLLGPQGGTPPAASWVPTVREWRSIAALGAHGLRYVVLAPDEFDLDDALHPGFSLRGLVELLYSNGIKIALGHFRHDDPPRSAERASAMIEFVSALTTPQRDALLTDHLYNDMPRNFRHEWRTDASELRDRELREFLQAAWEPGTLADLLGPVPSTLLAAALRGELLPCMNFDGAHVDLEICARTVEYLGAERLIAITDHVEVNRLAGQTLHIADDTTLWRREDGAVAAGSQDVARQIGNMRQIGMSEAEIALVISENPRRAARAVALRPTDRSVSG